MSKIKVKLFQFRPINKTKNFERIIDSIERGEFNIGIFPELFFSGYLIRDELNSNYITDYELNRIREKLPDDMVIVFGAPKFENFLYNSAFIVTRNGWFSYKKMHLPNFGPFEEKRYFKEGNTPLTFEFNGFKVNVEICYDIFFDDPLVNGSDIIINISASPFTSRTYFENVFQSIAIKKQAYFIYVNTVGLQRNLIFWGGSTVIDPDGNTVLKLPYFSEDSGVAIVDREIINEARMKRRVLRDEI